MNRALKIEQADTLWDIGPEEECLDPWLGRRIGAAHRIVQHLGSGGMGAVFLAQHEASEAFAAVKLLPAKRARTFRPLFAKEVELLSQQHHPNIVRALDSGELDDGSLYLLMERAEGSDLDRLLAGGPLAPWRSLRILRQVAAAIDHLHVQHVLHRDIKPANIMVDVRAADSVKLIDFGIAVREGSSEAQDTKHLIGTPAYMAPEQVIGGSWTRRSDLYSLAALALELLTGRPPYDYPSLSMTLAALQYEGPAMPSTRGLHAAGLDPLFARALARRPEDRFPTGSSFVAALQCILRTQRAPAVAAATACMAC